MLQNGTFLQAVNWDKTWVHDHSRAIKHLIMTVLKNSLCPCSQTWSLAAIDLVSIPGVSPFLEFHMNDKINKYLFGYVVPGSCPVAEGFSLSVLCFFLLHSTPLCGCTEILCIHLMGI